MEAIRDILFETIFPMIIIILIFIVVSFCVYHIQTFVKKKEWFLKEDYWENQEREEIENKFKD